MSRSYGYRPEIDGLRAIAVLSVVFFHAGFKIASGGFVGVDVFFVISGYLITGIIVRDLSEGRFSLASFYERRARRIFPALFVVMGACIPIAWTLMLPGEFKDFLNSLVAASLFVSNVFFWRQGDYFGVGVEQMPLIHTWSLAIEEQFYLAFPLFLLILWRFGLRAVVAGLVACALLSFAASIYGLNSHRLGNFYLTPTRVWELIAGAFCALALRKKSTGSDILALLGLSMIIFSTLAYDRLTPFPSIFTIMPVGGAMLIILFAQTRTRICALLSHPILVGLGLVSYSVYLWHQPLFAFARIHMLTDPPNVVVWALCLLSVFLGWITWLFVEQPVRSGRLTLLRGRSSVFAASAIAVSLTAALGIGLDNSTAYEARETDRTKYFHSYLTYNATEERKSQFREPECFLSTRNNDFRFYNKSVCLNTDPERTNAIIVGDSHAAQLWQAISEHFPGVNFMQATASGCKPVPPFEGARRCTELMRYVFDEVLPNTEIDSIILSARWSENDITALKETIDGLEDDGFEVTVIGPTASFEVEVPRILGRFEESTDLELQSIAASYLDANALTVSDKIAEMVAETPAAYVPLATTLCQNICKVIASTGEPVFFDDSHFTMAGARDAVAMLAARKLLWPKLKTNRTRVSVTK